MAATSMFHRLFWILCQVLQLLVGQFWIIKQLLDEVEHDIMNYQNWGLCYLPKPKAEADNTDTRFWYFMISCEKRIQ